MIPKTFAQPEKFVNSYDFVDTLTGVAYEILYAGGAGIELTDGILRNFVFDSADVLSGAYHIKTGIVAGTPFDADFDIIIGKQLTLDGEAVINGSVGFYNSTGNYNYTYYVQTNIIKDTGTEATVATGTSSTIVKSNATISTLSQERWCVNVDIPRETFAVGDILRLNIKVTVSNLAVSTLTMFPHDPGNSASSTPYGTWTDQTLKFFCPFKVPW